MAVGQTFVIITAGIDLSVGSIVGVSGVVAAIVANSLHMSGPFVFVVTLFAALGVGALSGYVNALPVVRLNLPPFISARRLQYSASSM